MLKESPTKIVLGLTALAALVAGLFAILPLYWFVVASAFMAYEFWTLFNRYPNDTISELIWTYKKRSIVPLMIGAAVGAGAMSGVLGEPGAVSRGLGIGLLLGHFFFTPEKDEEDAAKIVAALQQDTQSNVVNAVVNAVEDCK